MSIGAEGGSVLVLGCFSSGIVILIAAVMAALTVDDVGSFGLG